MPELVGHKFPGLNDNVRIQAVDGPGPGGAHHRYHLIVDGISHEIKFQEGPLKECAANGVSNEALLAVVLDRLEGFQTGDFKCRENAIAFTKIQEAMHWLHHRTRQRIERGVEGTLAV